MLKSYQHLFSLFDQHLQTYIYQVGDQQPSELFDPEAYILQLGGKRLRPILALIACDLFDKAPEKAIPSALCVELFHNFSLIHDDILDAAPLRRGQATVHKKWNTNVAILSGDVMLVKAFSMLQDYPAAEGRQLIRLFTQTAVEVCQGQQFDMNFENTTDVSVKDYLNMISLKTAVLLGCSLQMGAISAGAGKPAQRHLYEFGKNLGIAFQLKDDLMDAFAEHPEKFGKQTGGDILADKKTYLYLKAKELSEKKGNKEWLTLSTLQGEEKVKATLAYFEKLNVHKSCEKEIEKYTASAIKALKKVKASPSKLQQLEGFALELMKRES